MKEGPYIFWQSDEEYLEIRFELQHGEWIEKKMQKNIRQFPEIEVPFGHNTVAVTLHKPLSQKTILQEANKIIAFGDIHGELDQLLKILHAHEIIDEQFNWIFGNGQLVFCGDIFDRGSQVTECLWLIYHMEQQAANHGGSVHYLLGNHEVMALTGDHRYLHQKYKKIAAILHLEYVDLFSRESELGRWLRKKQTIISINDLLFVHAGLAPAYNKDLAELNQTMKNYLDGDERYYYFINDPQSPIWYRGYMYDWQGSAKISQAELEDILQNYGARKIIFAHTEVASITPLYQQLAIAIDVSFRLYPQALLIQEDEFFHIDEKGNKTKLF